MGVLLLERINRGETFSCARKFEHAMLVNTCDVFFKIPEALKVGRKT